MKFKSIRINEKVFNRMKNHSIKTGLPMSTMITFGMTDFIDKQEIERSDKYIKEVQLKNLSQEIKQLLHSDFIIIKVTPKRKQGILYNIEYTNK